MIRAMVLVSCAALFATGCGRGAANKDLAVAPGDRSVTLHVEGMSKRLNLF